MSTDREIEAKFRITDAATSNGLRSWPNLAYRYPLSPAHTVSDVDTYFDTADLRLLRTGRTLRVRVHDGAVLVTTKSIELDAPKGMHTRKEVEREAPEIAQECAALTLAELPTDVAAALDDHADGGMTFFPICRLQQLRTKRDLGRPAGAGTLAELSIDDVTVLRPTPAASKQSKSGAPPTWQAVAQATELEAELRADGDKSELKLVGLELRALAGVEPSEQNKLQQALLAIADAPLEDALLTADASARRAADARQHLAELCRRVWGQQLAVMAVSEAGVRDSDDIEYVHVMRVATRRARAAGRLYAQAFEPKSKPVRRAMATLRKTGRLLGAVRDLDVALARLDSYAKALPEAQQAEVAPLAAFWTARRDAAHRKLLAWLDAKPYARFVARLGRFVRTPGADVPPFHAEEGVPPSPHQVRHTIPSMILNRYESIRAFEVLFESGDAVPVPTLHALRIECKYLRYHLEFNAGLLGQHGADLIADLKALQEHLGDLNDAAVGEQMLTEARAALLGKPPRKRRPADEKWETVYSLDPAEDDAHLPATPADGWAPGAALDAYLARQGASTDELRARLPADLARFLSLETRRKLAAALAEI